jgi:hypothetical protein
MTEIAEITTLKIKKERSEKQKENDKKLGERLKEYHKKKQLAKQVLNEALDELTKEVIDDDLGSLEIIKQELNQSDPDTNTIEINIKPKKGRPTKSKKLEQESKNVSFKTSRLDVIEGFQH